LWDNGNQISIQREHRFITVYYDVNTTTLCAALISTIS